MNNQKKITFLKPIFSELPKGWKEERLLNVAEIRTSNIDKKSVDGEVQVNLCNYVDVYYNDKITKNLSFMPATATEQQIERFQLQVGDVIITKDSESPDDIGIPALVAEIEPNLVCGYHLSIVRPHEETVVGAYLFYALKSHLSVYQSYLAANGVTRFGLTQSGTKNLRIALPVFEEQKKIAAFLDRKTAQIDALIAKKKALLTLLKEQRLAVITQAVTKGLNPAAPMRDSGVSWLGQVPTHWDTIPLGFLMTMSGGLTPSMANSEFWEGDIPWVTPKDMKRSRIIDSIDHITEKALAETAISLIPINSILIVVRGMILAHSFPTAITDGLITINQDMKALRCDSRLDVDYLFWCLTGFAKVFSDLAQESAHGTRKIETTTLKKFCIPLPSLIEQREIVAKVKTSLEQLDQFASATKETISYLTEYRTALITAATTGKIDVCDFAIP